MYREGFLKVACPPKKQVPTVWSHQGKAAKLDRRIASPPYLPTLFRILFDISLPVVLDAFTVAVAFGIDVWPNRAFGTLSVAILKEGCEMFFPPRISLGR
jgi:hypothetical protein